jgi:hypothetical protein
VNEVTTYDLEKKAADERQRLHSSVAELRSCLGETLDLRKNTRSHLGVACGVATILGLTLGYSFTGIFVPNRRPKAPWHH